MLDEKDLQAIAGLMDEKIGASEARMAKKIEDSEVRMTEKIQDSEGRMLAMMEAYFEPRFNLLGDQIKLIQEKLTPSERVERLEDRLDVVETVAKQHSREIETLKKAQS